MILNIANNVIQKNIANKTELTEKKYFFNGNQSLSKITWMNILLYFLIFFRLSKVPGLTRPIEQ